MARSKKDVDRLVTKLRKQGWRVDSPNHHKVYPPNSTVMIVISSSPKCGSLAKVRKQLTNEGAIL